MAVIGIDPGRTGAAAVLDEGGQILALYSWRPRQRQGRKVLVLDSGEAFQSSACLGAHLARRTFCAGFAPDLRRVWCESQYVSKNARTGLTLARSAGMIAGPILAAQIARGESAPKSAPSSPVRWIMPSEWRLLVFGSTRRKNREEWKCAAIEYVAEKYGQTYTSDEAEAICIALAALNSPKKKGTENEKETRKAPAKA